VSHPHRVSETSAALAEQQAGWDIYNYAESLGFGDIYLKHDADTQLRAVIAIHNTQRGPALGGTRMQFYPSSRAAIEDAMLLAQGMTYKAAIAGLPYGGGKAVIMMPQQPFDRTALLQAYAGFVDELGGRYITSVDVGTGVQDMDVISELTDYVVGNSEQLQGTGDPSPYTALGVCYGIEAAVKVGLELDSLNELHVMIQGAGHVGAGLAKELHQRGARISISDINPAAAEKVRAETGATIVDTEQVLDTECDVFAPCALGGVLNQQSIARLKTGIVAGAANNQLQTIADGEALAARHILYAPDYIVNAGGLISIAVLNPAERIEKLHGIRTVLIKLFEQAMASDEATSHLADKMAEDILAKG